jgi:chromate transporter
MSAPGFDASAAKDSPALAVLFGLFFRIGLTSFGMAILQNLKTIVLRRGYLNEREIEEGLALVQLYPGPILVDLVAYIGYRRRGVPGALFAVGGFLLPAVLLMLVLSAAYRQYGNLPIVAAMLPGLGALVVGVVLNVTLDFARKNLTGWLETMLALSAFALGMLHGDMLWAVLIGIAVGAARWRHDQDVVIPPHTGALPWRRLLVPALLGAGLIALGFATAGNALPLNPLIFSFLKIGAAAFGNGATILPIMQQVVVTEHHWLDPSQFSAAIALGQVTPGPILNSATFVGYQVAGLGGALAATFAIFAPSVVMTMMFTELFAHVRHLTMVRGAIRGVMASFVGMLAWVSISLGQQALIQPVSLILAAAALVALRYLKWDTLSVFGMGLLSWAAWLWITA